MPSLQQLKAKWFIDVALEGQFPPHTRHPRTQLQPYTDGNLVEPVIDGAALMGEFNRRADTIITAPDPTQHELWLAQWRLEPVKLLGETNPGPDAETKILEVARSGAKVYFLGSGHVGNRRPTKAFAQKLCAVGGQGACDWRIPLVGSQHQKFYIFRGPNNDWLALLGSADLNYFRWDTSDHAAANPDRSPLSEGPSHDVTLRVRGPAVHDIALTFTERWNDPASRNRTHPETSNPISTSFLSKPIPAVGPHSVQVLRTYGIEKKRSYSWATQGEFTIWASYLNAIKQAQRYIYIEDQYFYPFNNPPGSEASAGKLQDSDLIYQLGEAIKRGVDVIVLVPSRQGNNNPTNVYQLRARGEATAYLRHLSQVSDQAGRFVICYPVAGEVDPVVHAKLMIVDDEFALVGSANVCQRSMTCDTEVHLGVVDADNRFARDLRLALWQEHLELDHSDPILDPTTGFDAFQKNATSKIGRLRLYPTEPGRKQIFHQIIMNKFMDPYCGPLKE
jgi:phosphatidylserine/phosphatidylglycerophosphate/cardiolipin synthase-like enzyme